jgi:hypothetical protein
MSGGALAGVEAKGKATVAVAVPVFTPVVSLA